MSSHLLDTIDATYLNVDPFLLLEGLKLLHKSLLRHDVVTDDGLPV